MNLLALQAPEDWRAIYLAVATLDMNEENTRGSFLENPDFFDRLIGGFARHVVAAYVPEPAPALLQAAALGSTALLARLRRRRIATR